MSLYNFGFGKTETKLQNGFTVSENVCRAIIQLKVLRQGGKGENRREAQRMKKSSGDSEEDKKNSENT